MTKVGSVLLQVLADGSPRTVRLNDVHVTPLITRSIISYGILEKKGFRIKYENGQRTLVDSRTGTTVFDVQMKNNVLVVQAQANCTSGSSLDVIMAVVNEEVTVDPDVNVQSGTLMEFHQRLAHLSYDTIERMARDPRSGIELSDKKRENCLTCAHGKQTKSKQSKEDTGKNSPIDRIGGVICSDLKGPMTPMDRMGNRYLINLSIKSRIIVEYFWLGQRMLRLRSLRIFWYFLRRLSNVAYTFCAPAAVVSTRMSTSFAKRRELHGSCQKPKIKHRMGRRSACTVPFSIWLGA